MMRVRTWGQQLVRGLLIVAIVMTPLIGDRMPLPIFSIAIGAFLAYDGLESRMVTRTLMVVVATELVWGIDLGVLSLSYLVAVAIMLAVHRVITLSSLSQHNQWSVVALLKTGVLAWALSLVITMVSLGVEVGVYGHGKLESNAVLTWSGLGALALVVLLYRIDVPFRRRITFGH